MVCWFPLSFVSFATDVREFGRWRRPPGLWCFFPDLYALQVERDALAFLEVVRLYDGCGATGPRLGDMQRRIHRPKQRAVTAHAIAVVWHVVPSQ